MATHTPKKPLLRWLKQCKFWLSTCPPELPNEALVALERTRVSLSHGNQLSKIATRQPLGCGGWLVSLSPLDLWEIAIQRAVLGNTRKRDGQVFHADCDYKVKRLSKLLKAMDMIRYWCIWDLKWMLLFFFCLKTWWFLVGEDAGRFYRVILSRAYGATSRCGWDCQLVTSLFKWQLTTQWLSLGSFSIQGLRLVSIMTEFWGFK